MAYRAMPHCTTKYSPYYLVFGREMRLPIEDDWKPSVSNFVVEQDEYEKHVEKLVERLREANKVASQESRMSHETAKRYYDRQTKVESFRKGDFVYVRDPVYKRGKAKKFSNQYKGPYEIEGKVSALVYKVRMLDGTFAIVHINRLKKAYDWKQEVDRTLLRGKQGKMLKKSKDVQSMPCQKTFEDKFGKGERPSTGAGDGHRRDSLTESEIDERLPPHVQLAESETESLSETDEGETVLISREHGSNSDRSAHLQRKPQSDKSTADVAYQLRSRTVNRSGSGKERNEIRNDVGGLEENNDENRTAFQHSYNLRSKVGNKPVNE